MATYEKLSGKFVKVSSPEPHVLLVELARNPVNSFTEEFWTEYGNVFDQISLENDVRAVVLASALPKLFSAGLDLKGSEQSADESKEPARRALQLRKHIQLFQSAISATERCPYPVIAAVHGVAYGLAIDIIAACDVRLAAEDVKLAIKEVDVGLASDIGTLARLPKLAGNQSLVHEYSYTARPFSALEAEKMGLVSRVVPGSRTEVVNEALAIAKTIAAKSPVAVHGTKRVLQYSRDHSVQDSLEFVAGWNAAMLQTADLPAAMQATMAKQVPTFKPLAKFPSKL